MNCSVQPSASPCWTRSALWTYLCPSVLHPVAQGVTFCSSLYDSTIMLCKSFTLALFSFTQSLRGVTFCSSSYYSTIMLCTSFTLTLLSFTKSLFLSNIALNRKWYKIFNICTSLWHLYYIHTFQFKCLLLILRNSCVILQTSYLYFICLYVCLFVCLIFLFLFVNYFTSIDSLSLL